MKINIILSIRIIIIVPLLTLLLLSAYQLNIEYKNYQDTIKIDNIVKFNSILEDLVKSFSKERKESASLYIKNTENTRNNFDIVKNETNENLKNLKIFSDNNKELNIDISYFENLKSELDSMRSLTLKKEVKFNYMYFDFYTGINKNIIELIEDNNNVFNNKKLIILNMNYNSIIKKYELNNIKISYISYLTSLKSKLKPQEIRKAIEIIEKSKISLNVINPSNELLKDTKRIKQIEKENKINMIDVKNNYYKNKNVKILISKTNKWKSFQKEKIEILYSSSKKIKINIENLSKKLLIESKFKTSIYVFVLSFVLFLFILGFKIIISLKNNIKNLEQLFKRMAGASKIKTKTKIDLKTEEGTNKAYEVIDLIVDSIEKDKRVAIEATKSKSDFLAKMSHEIRTPLNGITGFTNLLKETELSDDQKEFVSVIDLSSKALIELVNDILDSSKVESGNIQLENIMFDPFIEFEQAVEIYGPKASEKDIDLSLFIEPCLIEKNIQGDPTKLRQVIINLMSNAVKFTDEGGSIDLSITKVLNENEEKIHSNKITLEFAVQDSGIGIPEDKIPNVFGAYQQVDESTSRKYGGTGLGMTISYDFIKAMGGTIEIKSEVGVGSKFYFILEFEIEEKELKIPNYSKLKLGVLTSNNEKKQTEISMNYNKSINIDMSKIYNFIELERLNEKRNILLLDFDYLKTLTKEEMKKFINFKSQIIIVSKSKYISKMKNFSEKKNIHIMYEPYTYTKNVSIYNKLLKINPNNVKVSNTNINTNTNTNLKVMLADDDLINLKLTKMALEKMNYKVTTVENGLLAFEKRKDEEFDFIIMDSSMPEMDGIESTEEIIKWELENNKKHIPIIAYTANAYKGDREKYLNAGMDEYITKPLNISKLKEALDKVGIK